LWIGEREVGKSKAASGKPVAGGKTMRDGHEKVATLIPAIFWPIFCRVNESKDLESDLLI
jgi:hypothetical protein